MVKKFAFLWLQRISIVCFLLVPPTMSKAQSLLVHPRTVLADALQAPEVQNAQALHTWSQQLNYRVPLFKEVQLRLGINGSALGDTIFGYLRNEDVYGLQFSTNSLRERRTQRAVGVAQTAVLAATEQTTRLEVLTDRYRALTDAYFAQIFLKNYTLLDSLLRQRRQLYRHALQMGLQVRVKDVVDAEADLEALQGTLGDWETKRQTALVRAQLPPDAHLDTTQWVTPTIWAARIEAVHAQPISAPDLEERLAKMRLAASELAYINSQNKQIFNLFRVGYDYPLYLQRPNKFNTFNNFSMRLALNIPLPANNRYKQARALLDLREAETNAATAQIDHAHRLREAYARWLGHWRAWERQTQQNRESLLPTLLQSPALLAQLTPEEILDLHLRRQRTALLLLEQRYALHRAGLDYLALTGALGQLPLRNYLEE